MALTLDQIAAQYQVVTADIRFLAEDEGGRRTTIDLTIEAEYRPHFVIEDRTKSSARTTGSGSIEPYVAMAFLDGPTNYSNGEVGIFLFYCPNWTLPKHPDIDVGTQFTIREGGKVVAEGTVTKKTDPSQAKSDR